MRIRTAEPGDAASLAELWMAAGLKLRPGQVTAELAAVLARDPDLVLIAEDADGLTAAVLGTFDGRRGWVNRLATRPGRRGRATAARSWPSWSGAWARKAAGRSTCSSSRAASRSPVSTGGADTPRTG